MDKYEQYKQVFNHFNSNKDGKISPVELQQCMVSIAGNMTAEEAATAVALMDSDGDGLLSFDDLVTLVEGGGEDDLKAAFQMYAPQGSGCITPQSLKNMLSRLGDRRSVDDCKTMIARFDLNGDGVLNFDEFKVMMSC